MSKKSEIKFGVPTIERRTEGQYPLRCRMTHRIVVPAPNFKKAKLMDSLLERDGSLWGAFSSNVLTYDAQPLTLKFECAGTIIVSKPDVEVTYVDGSSELLEIKYLEQYLDPKVRQKCRRVKDQFASMGIRYRVVTEKQIRRCPMHLKNFHRLLGYRLEPLVLPSINWLQPGKEYLVADVADKLGSDSLVFHLIAKGNLTFDFSKPLTLKTRVRKATPSDSTDFI